MVDRVNNPDDDEKVLTFDGGDALLPQSAIDMVIDDPDGNGDLALGGSPLPLDPKISELKRRKKPTRIRNPWR